MSKRLDILPSIVVLVYRTIVIGFKVTTFSFTLCDLYRFEVVLNVVNFLGITSS